MRKFSFISATIVVAVVLLSLPCLIKTSPTGKDSYVLTQEDDQFLDRLERASILFFWEQADPKTGQIRDRVVVTGIDETRPGLDTNNKIKA